MYLIANPFILAVILACVEILRRAQWNIFRLENEQLNNVGKFRAVNVVVPPIDQVSISGNLGAAKPIILDTQSRKDKSEGVELQDVSIHYSDQPPTPNFQHDREKQRSSSYGFKIPKIFQPKPGQSNQTQQPKKKGLDFSKLSSYNDNEGQNKSAPTSLQGSPVNNRLRSSFDASLPEKPLLSSDNHKQQ